MRTSLWLIVSVLVAFAPACDPGLITTDEAAPDAGADEADAGRSVPAEEPPDTCGDGVCDSGEDCSNCPGDCGACAECGDGACSGSESKFSCPADCVVCGDGDCNPPETMGSCPTDCVSCGDGTCGGGEDRYNCATDCERCGDGTCGPAESPSTCAADCVSCGDGVCNGPETRTSCPADCERCGDGVCGVGETSSSCCNDCGCSGGYVCDGGTCAPPCSSEAFYLTNAMPDFWMYSVACSTSLLQISLMRVCNDTDCSPFIASGGYVTYTVPYDEVDSVHGYCCYSDGTTCFGQTHWCDVDGESYPCRCGEGDVVLVADTCPSEVVVVCE